jgi:tRNA threonylcarbamoyladenosine biosynthesis protein TsaE
MKAPFCDIVFKLNDLKQVAKTLLEKSGSKIFLFEGEMGSGKTTLIKEMCKQLGSHDHFSSPTYSIVNEYAFPGGRIFHLDLYRVSRVEELLDLGIEEYLDSGQYCLIEWPSLAENLIEDDYVRVVITVKEEKRALRAYCIQG